MPQAMGCGSDLIPDASAINRLNGARPAIRVTEPTRQPVSQSSQTAERRVEGFQNDLHTAAVQSKWFPPFVTATKEILSSPLSPSNRESLQPF